MVGCLYILLLMIPPTSGFTLTGPSSSATLGQRFRFNCTETGPPKSSLITFTGNGRNVCVINRNACQQFLAAFGYSCSCGQSGVYHVDIAGVSVADGGTWTCQTSQTTSNRVTLTVYYGPFNNVTVDKASPVTVIENITVSLTARCSAVCNPDCSYTWSKGTQQVSDNRDLPVGSFRRDQEGEFRCTARNTATGATADSQTLTVNVQWYPAQPTHNCPSLIVPGQTVSCTCQTSDRGNPVGALQWISPGGQTVSSSGSSSVQLNLTSIPRSDDGLSYICRANNSLPSSNSDVTYVVKIASLPRYDASKQTNNLVTGQLKTTASLVANVVASPLANFTWFHYQEMTPVPVVVGTGGHEVLTEGLQSVLRVYINREEDYGIYRVVVSNRVGSTSLFFSLTKHVSPSEVSSIIIPIAAGMGAVIVILIVILIVVVILYRRNLGKGSD